MLVLDPTAAVLYASVLKDPTTPEEKTRIPDSEHERIRYARDQCILARSAMGLLGIDTRNLTRFNAICEILSLCLDNQ